MAIVVGTASGETLIGTDDSDIIEGLGGDDIIFGRGGDDTIEGGDGADTIEGGDGNDLIRDGAGDDSVLGGDGNDTIYVGAGADRVDGGAGDDTIIMTSLDGGANRFDGGAGLFDTLDLSQLSGGLDVSYDASSEGLFSAIADGRFSRAILTETRGFERLIGHATSANYFHLAGLTTAIEIITGSGNDNLEGGLGADTIRAGGGADSIIVGAGDSAFGEDGDDILTWAYATTGPSPTRIDGGAGVDELRVLGYTGETSIDLTSSTLGAASIAGIENLNVTFVASDSPRAGVITGTGGANTIFVGGVISNNIVTVYGGDGADMITTLNTRGFLYGEAGNDVLRGSGMADFIDGGDGDDLILNTAGGDTVAGGFGIDTLDLRLHFTGHTVDMVAGTSQFTIGGVTTTTRFSEIENITSNTENDVITGNDAANIIRSLAGDDIVRGGGGDDMIDGGAGADQLFGDAGDDILIGLGNDTIDGGDGVDTLRLSGRAADYRVMLENGQTVLSRTNERIVVSNVERFEFADTVVTGTPGVTQDVFGTTGADRLTGTAGNDRIIAADGDDFLIGAAGNDLLDGGAGIDTAGYYSLVRSYVVTRGSGGFVGVGGGVEGGADVLTSIERLSFLDGTLDMNPNGAAAQIYRLYDATLDRTPDQAGFAGWVSRLASGTTLAQAAQTFAGSTEFSARYGALNNEDFVKQLYRLSLDREGDASGVAQWKAQLDSGVSRGTVLLAFSESVEHRNLTAAGVNAGLFIQDDRTIAVARLYDAAFDRVPDREGIAYWRGTLEGGGSLFAIANAFVSSQEFQDHYGALNNQQFIEQLYRFTLNRDADALGLQVWTDRLNAGTTRAEMVVIFSESVEHVDLTAPTWDGGVRFENYVEPTATMAETTKGIDGFVLPAEADGGATWAASHDGLYLPSGLDTYPHATWDGRLVTVHENTLADVVVTEELRLIGGLIADHVQNDWM